MTARPNVAILFRPTPRTADIRGVATKGKPGDHGEAEFRLVSG